MLDGMTNILITAGPKVSIRLMIGTSSQQQTLASTVEKSTTVVADILEAPVVAMVRCVSEGLNKTTTIGTFQAGAGMKSSQPAPRS